MTSRRPPTPPDHPSGTTGDAVAGPDAWAKIKEAVEARDVLAAALTRAGIQLPAMDVRDGDGQARYGLVQLGFCSAPVAQALAAVIARGTER